MPIPEFLKNLLMGSGASSGVRNFKYKRGVAPVVLYFGMAAFAALGSIVVFGGNNPLATTVAWMIFGLTILIAFATLVFAHFNPHDSLEGKVKADHIERMRSLAAMNPAIIEHSPIEPVPNPHAPRKDAQSQEDGGLDV